MMERSRARKMSPGLKTLLTSIAIIIVAVAIVGLSMLAEYLSTGEGTDETVTIEVVQGENVWDIAEKLKEEDLIAYEVVFYLKARNTGADGRLRYGTFTFHKESGLGEIIEVLTTGGAQKESVMFTVPEGYSIEMIAKKLEAENICTGEEFLQAVQQDYDYWFLESIPDNKDIKYKLQGFLFPETYAITDDMTAEDIVKVMLKQFDKAFTEEMQARMDTLGKDIFTVVVEASIIEREAKVPEERPMISGVIQNRLDIGMKLQMCPTALYPITDGNYDKNFVTIEDTQFDSPYNTYVYAGLPVGPIANPGAKSLEAALNPVEHEYLFYHTNEEKKDGSHIFTKTYQEHVNTQ